MVESAGIECAADSAPCSRRARSSITCRRPGVHFGSGTDDLGLPEGDGRLHGPRRPAVRFRRQHRRPTGGRHGIPSRPAGPVGVHLARAGIRTYSYLRRRRRAKPLVRCRFRGVRYRPGGARVRLGEHPYAKELASLGLPKRALVSSSAANVEMSFGDAQEIREMTVLTTKPDVDLTDGTFYADGVARAAYKWMRANEPVFRDRNGLAAAATYQAVIEAERNPELFSNAGGIRPDTAGHADDDRHGRSRTSVAAQARQRRLHPKAGEGQGAVDRQAVRHADRRGMRARRVRLRPGHRRAAADGGDRRHARCAARRARDVSEVVRRPGHRAQFAIDREPTSRSRWRPSPATPHYTTEHDRASGAPSRPKICSASWSTPRSRVSG